jgi:hypothetical protein
MSPEDANKGLRQRERAGVAFSLQTHVQSTVTRMTQQQPLPLSTPRLAQLAA